MVVLFFTIVFYSTVFAISNDELRDWENNNQIAKDRKERIVNINEPATVLNNKKYSTNKKKKRKRIKSKSRSNVSSTLSDEQNKPQKNATDHSLSPARIVSTTNQPAFSVFSDSPGGKTKLKYGISWGTWARASLNRTVNSHDNAAIEIYTSEDIVGKYRIIPKGSLLTGRHVLNTVTNRLTMQIIKGITPEGKEFIVQASIFDIEKRNGLQGYEINPIDKTQQALQKGVQTTTGAVLQQVLSPINPLAAGLVTTGQELLNQELDQPKTKSVANIRVDPQSIFLRIDESL
ncbi:MAG: conjugative transposon protein TraM [Methylacidiphilales bacterium]|nr:conjugative transposon protein TraM [Candidatus Methylacidiphilales bacterium]